MTQEVTTESGLVIPAQGGTLRLNPGELGTFDENMHDWNTLQREAIGMGGADLLDKDLIEFLVKVPHTIVKACYYQGEFMDNGHEGAFVALTAMIAPDDLLRRRFKGNDKASNVDALPFDPEDVIVYNDGSTGPYRQVTRKLAEYGYIQLVEKGEGIIEGGHSGESTYDLHPAKWAGITNDPKRARILPRKESGKDVSEWGGLEFNIRISAPRGLRYSSYDGPFGKANTKYIG